MSTGEREDFVAWFESRLVPAERALHEAGDKLIRETEHLHPGWSLEREYPLTPGLLAVSHAWRTGTGSRRQLTGSSASAPCT